MQTFTKLITAGALAATVMVAPVAAFAQTSGTAQSTGDRESAKERSEVDKVRKHQSTSPMKAKKGTRSGSKKAPVPATNTRS